MTDAVSPPKSRVALYARVSGDEQTVGRNIEAQIAELTQSIPPNQEIVTVYMDDGVSGAIRLADRPQGSRLMADAVAGNFDQVLATKLDRIGRDLTNIRQFADKLAELGISLTASGFQFGPDTIGRLFLNLLGAFAEFERDLIKDRTLSGKRHKAKTMGRWPGGTKPYGYSYFKGEAGEDGKWEIIEQEAQTVRRIYEMCVRDGMGMSLIADKLTNEAVPTPSAVIADPAHPRAKPKFHVGISWERSHVNRILRNSAYMGTMLVAVDGERKGTPLNQTARLIETGEWREMGLIELGIPAIVDSALWWAAQRTLDARRRLPNPQYESWPLQGRVVCATDGRVFKCRRNGQKGARTYSCSGREGRAHLEGSSRCTTPRLDSDRLEAALVWRLNGLLSNPRTGKQAIEDYLAKVESTQEKAVRGLAPFLQRLDELREQEGRLDDLYGWGRLSREEYESRLHEVIAAIKEVESERGERQREIDEFDTRQREIAQIRAAIEENRISMSLLPSANKLRIRLLKQEDDTNVWLDEWLGSSDDADSDGPPAFYAQPQRERPVAKLKRGIQGWEEISTEAKFESPMELRQLFELFDINVVVYSDYVEVRGVFPQPIELGVDEIKETGVLQGKKVPSSRTS